MSDRVPLCRLVCSSVRFEGTAMLLNVGSCLPNDTAAPLSNLRSDTAEVSASRLQTGELLYSDSYNVCKPYLDSHE
jgi:hypothetical protein